MKTRKPICSDATRSRVSRVGPPVSGNGANDAAVIDTLLLNCPALSALERQVLQVRYGAPGRMITYAEAARRLALSPDAVCEIEIGALQKLRLSSLEAHASAVGGWDEV